MQSSRLLRGQFWCYLHFSHRSLKLRPLPFVWPYALVFWAIYIWAFAPQWGIIRRASESAKRADSQDSGTLRVLMAGPGVALMLAFPLAFVKASRFPERAQIALFAIGVTMILLGSLLRRYCWRTLGEYFTGDVQARAGQPVIRSGPYRLVRHPSYTAGMMMFIGIGVALGSWLSFLLLAIASIASYGYRVSVEERALLGTIGEPYAAFMKERKRFIPFVV